jgi:hypothetical protein
MRSGFVASLLIIIVSFACDTTGTVDPLFKQYFIKYYGEDGDQQATDFLLTPSNQFLIIGNTFSSSSNYRMYLVVADSEGNVLVEKRLGTNQELARDMEPIVGGPDAGNFVVLSNVRKNAADSLAIRLTIINSQGDSLKSFYYNTLASQEGISVTPLNDGSYFISGKTTDTDASLNTELPSGLVDKEDQLVMYLNPDFSVNYLKRIGGSAEGACVKILPGSTSFYYSGYSDALIGSETGISNYENNFDFRVFTTDPSAGSVNFNAGTPGLPESLATITRSGIGAFLAVGTQRLSSTQSRLYAVLINTEFSPAGLSEGILPLSSDNYEAVHAAPSGTSRFLIVANRINASGKSDIWVGRITTEFVTDFQATFGEQNTNDRAVRVMELPNGDVVVLGNMNLSNQDKMALIKLTSDGNFE